MTMETTIKKIQAICREEYDLTPRLLGDRPVKDEDFEGDTDIEDMFYNTISTADVDYQCTGDYEDNDTVLREKAREEFLYRVQQRIEKEFGTTL